MDKKLKISILAVTFLHVFVIGVCLYNSLYLNPWTKGYSFNPITISFSVLCLIFMYIIWDSCRIKNGSYDEENADLSKCPNCGGPADNGHDRCYPPNPYYCTKCEDKE